MLEILGLGELEHQLYGALVDLRESTVAQLTQLSGSSEKDVRRALASLSAKSLVTRRSDRRPQTFIPMRPDLALKNLVEDAESDLAQARSAADELVRRFRESHQRDAYTPVVEVVVGGEQVCQTFLDMVKGATDQLLNLSRPPYSEDPSASSREELAEIDALNRGVSCRVIYQASGIRNAAHLGTLQRLVGAGEIARFKNRVPMKLAITDKKLALVPLSSDDSDVARALLVRESALLDALVVMFEMLWHEARSIELIRTTESIEAIALDGRERKLSRTDMDLVALLALGMKDESIARHLQVSVRTVIRRVNQLMDLLDAQSRLQLGMRLVDSGLVEDIRVPDSHMGITEP